MATLLCVLACLGVRRLNAQAATATIIGTVTDTSGASIPDAAITATNTGTGLNRTTMSTGQRDRAGDILLADSTIFTTLFGGNQSLERFWANLASKWGVLRR